MFKELSAHGLNYLDSRIVTHSENETFTSKGHFGDSKTCRTDRIKSRYSIERKIAPQKEWKIKTKLRCAIHRDLHP